MRQTTGKARSKGPKMKTESVEVRPAENGFTVRHHKRPAVEGKGEPYQFTPPEETVHEDADSMLGRVGEIFGKGKPAAGEPDGDEGKAE
jgi:hypothetical protein